MAKHPQVVRLAKEDIAKPDLDGLREELFPQYSSNAFQAKYTDLWVAADMVEKKQRSAEIFTLQDQHNHIGFLILHYYDWRLLAPQRVIGAKKISGGQDYMIWPARMRTLRTLDSVLGRAAEIAGVWVRPDHRRRGWGTTMLQFAWDRIVNEIAQTRFVFLSARGNANREIGTAVYARILRIVAANSAAKELSLKKVLSELAFPLDSFETAPQALVVKAFALDRGFEFGGFTLSGGKLFWSETNSAY
jgi:ribosomal protein S18 acetylase RimI-like enzyme